jgi:ABC-2 type transport system permease protein
MARVESFQVVMHLVVPPLFFLSGALFPLRHQPGRLTVLTRLDAFKYVVDPMRGRGLHTRATTPAVAKIFGGSVTWGSWHVPVGIELGLTAAFTSVMFGLAVLAFSKTD